MSCSSTMRSFLACSSCKALGAYGADDLPQQPCGLILQCQDVSTDLIERPQRLRLVEVAGEADLVAGLHAVRHVPGVGGVRHNLAAQEGLDATGFEQRHLLAVAQAGIGLVFDDGGLAADPGLEEST